MSPHITIRQATLTDAKDISALIQPLTKKYISYEFQADAESKILDSMSEKAIADYIKQGFDYFVAESNTTDDARLVGVLGIKFSTHVYHLFVRDACHRQGVAKSLWRHYLSLAPSRKITVNSSHYAVEIYHKLGFKKAGEIFEKHGISCVPMVFDNIA